MERLRQEGFTLLSETPRKGADNKMVCFTALAPTLFLLVGLLILYAIPAVSARLFRV